MMFSRFAQRPHFPDIKDKKSTSLTVTQAVVKRNSDLTPTMEEQVAISSLVRKIETVFENITLDSSKCQYCNVKEIRVVGSFKNGTMLTGSCSADIVLILEELPTNYILKTLKDFVSKELHVSFPDITFGEELNDENFEISSQGVTVKCFLTTAPKKMKRFNADPHTKAMCQHLAAIRHTFWFDEKIHDITGKALVRLLKDLKIRFKGLEALNPWMIDLLADFALHCHQKNVTLQLDEAFLYCLQLLSVGIFIPGSAGFPDPCERYNVDVSTYISLEQQDLVCLTAQTLYRISLLGGIEEVLGLREHTNLLTDNSVWNGVVVAPMSRAFEAGSWKRN